MKPESVFAASFFRSERENYAGDRWTVKASYTLDKWNEFTAEAGLRCNVIDWPHPDLQTWLLITHSANQFDMAERTSIQRVLQIEEENRYVKRMISVVKNSRWTRLGVRLRMLKIRSEFKTRELRRAIRTT